MKKDIQKIYATDSDLPNATIKLYLKSLFPHYPIFWSKRKVLCTLGKIHSYFISNGSVKINLQDREPSISITHTADFEKYFPSVDLSAAR